MWRARLTYKGAFHHVTSRAHGGENIFRGDGAKARFIDILQTSSLLHKVRVFVYCVMDNHYHLILQNSSGKLSEFMKKLNGEYGSYYRKKAGGAGYVFQGRFGSTLIEEDKYMTVAVVYALLNPVRAGIVSSPWDYEWSSINEYFAGSDTTFLDAEFVRDLFGEKVVLNELLREWRRRSLPVRASRAGDVLGDDEFIEFAMRKSDRRKMRAESKRRRIEEYGFEPAEKVIVDFEKRIGSHVEKIDTGTRVGSRLRDELLVMLKDRAGMTYTEIVRYPLFQPLKHYSLGQLYRRAKARMRRTD
jgi:REP element-mobilizing transposase RayT